MTSAVEPYAVFAQKGVGGAVGSALPGTRLSCVWNGTAWTYGGSALSARPSSRTDIFFELYGAPAATADPAWMINGDSRVDL